MFRSIVLLAMFMTAPLATARPLPGQPPPPPPTLLAPRAGAVLDNGCENREDGVLWSFEWSAVPGADRYHLYVIGQAAKNPVVDDDKITTNAYARLGRGSYIVGRVNLYGWRWRVRARVHGVWTGWSEERRFEVEPLDTDCTSSPDVRTGEAVGGTLVAPGLISPAPDTVFEHFPRTTTLAWAVVPGAAQYRIEVDYGWDGKWNTEQPGGLPYTCFSASSSVTFDFVGAQPGRWRVTPIGSDGKDGPTSEWRTFRYTR